MKIKNLILTVAATAVILAGAIGVQAQVPTYAPQTLWSTNGAGIPAATAVALNSVIDARKQSSVALQITAYGDTGVAAGKLLLSYSVDGISFSPTIIPGQFSSIAVTPTTTGRTMFTNVPTWGCGYIRGEYYTNDTGAAVTNLVIKYGVKISAP